MPNVSSFGAQTDNSVVQGTVTDRAMVIPDIPPQGLMSVGPRVTPHFVKPSLWSALTTYHFFDAVHDAAGASYVAIKPEVPAGTELTDEDYWFLWADPNSQFADLSELVKTFDGRITQNTTDIAAEITRATNAEAGKAPTNHASNETIYGVGNSLNYGHVRLASDDTPMTSGPNDGVAATPQTVEAAFEAREKTELVVFGDSWNDERNSPAAVWVRLVADDLGLTAHNYSQSGIGDALDSQINRFKSDTFDKNKIKYVIFMDGVNVDITHTSATAGKWVTFINEVSSVIPEDTKMYWFMNSGVKYTNADNPEGADIHNIVRYSYNQSKLTRVIYDNNRRCTFVKMFGWFTSDMFDQTGYHLQADYQRDTLAPNVINILTGAPIIQSNVIYNYRRNIADKIQTWVFGYLVGDAFIVNVMMECVQGQSVTPGFNETVTLPWFGYPVDHLELTVKGKPIYCNISIDNGNVQLNVKCDENITFDQYYTASATYMKTVA